MIVPDIRHVTACRLCGSTDLWEFFTLGEQPLANDLVPPDRLNQPDFRAPLAVMRCDDCSHVQLTYTVAPQLLFSDYRFVSGTTAGWHAHCDRLAAQLTAKHGSGFVIDIGANDGTLLTKFSNRGWRTLGIDPANNLPIAPSVRMECCEWGLATANRLAFTHGRADVIIAQNVLGHVDDPVDFLRGIRSMLTPHGAAYVEVPDLRQLLKTCAFDTIYHEHLSYWSLLSFSKAAKRAGLVVTNTQLLPAIHGGSLRFTVQHEGHTSLSLGWRLLSDYRALHTRAPFEKFQAQVEERLKAIGALFAAAEGPFWGYAASAKATVLLNALQQRGVRMPDQIVDDTPGKQGLYVPGVRVPIVKPEAMETCETLVLLAWNWADELKRRAVALGFRGAFLIPMPEPRIEHA